MKFVIRKKISLIIILCVIFIGLQLVFWHYKNKHIISYTINSFNINEEYNVKIKDSYYINIIKDSNIYSYQFQSKYFGKNIITDIKYYEDEKFECILPIFNNQIIFDITCLNKNDKLNYTYLHNMDNISEQLLDFARNIEQYDIKKFKNESKIIDVDNYNIYVNNINKNVSVETYRGLIINTKKIDLFNNDIYNRLSVYTNNYYIVPSYKDEYEFNEFYIVNLNNSKVKKIKLDYNISYSSYFEGIDGNTIYLFDPDNKMQYKIDCKRQKVSRIGSLNSDINIYEDGKWTKKSVSDVMKNNYYFNFNNYRKKINNDEYQDFVNNYIYTFIRNENGYKVFKSNKYTPNLKNYLFDVSDIDSIIYDNDNFYFKKDDYIGYYSEISGIKKIIQSNELLFNKNILFKVTL